MGDFPESELKSTLPSKTSSYIIKGAATIAAAYGIFKLWNYFSEEDEYFDNLKTVKDPRECRVLIIGLDGAGKTRFARCFCKGRRRRSSIEQTTIGFYVNSVMLGSIYLNMWDVGGSEACRKYWKEFIPKLDAICFVVDSANAERFDEARRELHNFLAVKGTEGIPLVIVTTKQDLPSAIAPRMVYRHLQLEGLQQSRSIYHVSIHAPDSGPRHGVMETYRLLEKLTHGKHKSH